MVSQSILLLIPALAVNLFPNFVENARLIILIGQKSTAWNAILNQLWLKEYALCVQMLLEIAVFVMILTNLSIASPAQKDSMPPMIICSVSPVSKSLETAKSVSNRLPTKNYNAFSA